MTGEPGRTNCDGTGELKIAPAATGRRAFGPGVECSDARRPPARLPAARSTPRQCGSLPDQDDFGFVRIHLPLGQALSCGGNESFSPCGFPGRATRLLSFCGRGDSGTAKKTGATRFPDAGSHGKDIRRCSALSKTQSLIRKPGRTKSCRRSGVDERRRDSRGRARNRRNAGAQGHLQHR